MKQRWVWLVLLALGGCTAAPTADTPPDTSAKGDRDNENDDDSKDDQASSESALTPRPTTAEENARCGGPSDLPCRTGLVCVATPATTAPSATPPSATCLRPAEVNGVCTIDADCRTGLHCNRKRASDPQGTCNVEEQPDDGDAFICKELSRCCGRIPELVNRLACAGAVAAGNEKACGLALALCGGR